MATQGKGIRIAVVAFPVGLFVLGVASMLYTQFKPERPEYDDDYRKRMEAASLNRTSVNQPDLERFVKILSTEIGERNLQKPENLERAAIWILSTLKGGNYQVNTQLFPVDGDKEVRNLWVDLTGRSRRREIIVVGCHYDSPANSPGANAGTGVASVLALARAFAGDPQERTLRFAFFANSGAASEIAAKKSAEDKERIVAMLQIDSVGHFSSAVGSQTAVSGLETTSKNVGDFISFLGADSVKFRIDSATKIFSGASGIPAFSANRDNLPFAVQGFPSIAVSDTGSDRFPEHGKAGDTYEKIDFAKLEKVCLGLQAILENWANP